jgi:ketosteroid isomerase-like protein
MKKAIVVLLLICQSLAWAQSATPSQTATPAQKSTPSQTSTPAQTSTPSQTATPSKVDPETAKKPEDPAHEELRALRGRMQTAMNSQDIEGLLAGVTDDVVFSTMNGDVVRGKDGIRDYFTKMMTGPDAMVRSLSTNFEADDLTLLFGGSLGEPEDAGVAFGSSKDSYTLRDGSKFEVQPRWTATMIREPDGWKVASFHYSVSMFDNPVLSKLTKSVSMVGGGALAVGLLLGLVIGFVLGRRKKG